MTKGWKRYAAVMDRLVKTKAGTKLHQRLSEEARLLWAFAGYPPKGLLADIRAKYK
jgi:hypothetical protein